MNFGSLFSGIGGFDLGFERAGMTCAWQCEIDPAASALLARHWPGIPNFGDVHHVGRDTTGAVDLICGGFPCQDVSVAGKREGLAGERSGLWFEFHRVLDELRPAWVVIENVPGLLSSNRGRDFAAILYGLGQLRYRCAWRVFDAQYFGVAQRRRRVFIVGHLGDGRAAEVLFESESLRRDTPPHRDARQGVAGTALPLTASGRGTERADESRGQDTVIPVVMAHGQAGAEIVSDGSPSLTCNHEQPIIFEARFARNGRGAPDNIAPPLKAENGQTGKGDGAPLVAYNIQHNDGGAHRRKDRPNGGLYVNATDTALTVGSTDLTAIAFQSSQSGIRQVEQHATLNGNNGSRRHNGVIQPSGVRRLTPLECERLQGFPDGWTDEQSDSARYRQLGNAVCVPVAEWIARRIMEAA